MVLILILLNLAHWMADYTHLSTAEMLNAKRLGAPLLPILKHATVHGFIMNLFLWFFVSGWVLFLLFLLQVGSHFLIDLWKGRMNSWFPSIQNPTNKLHWYVFGFDQYLHQAIIILMAYIASNGV